MKKILIEVSPTIESTVLWLIKRIGIKYRIVYEGNRPGEDVLLKDIVSHIDGKLSSRIENVLIAFIPRYHELTAENFVLRYSKQDLLSRRTCGMGSVAAIEKELLKYGYNWK